jgi:phenylalanyl-tRNA synthetase beta chain
MKFTLSWLKQFLDTDHEPSRIAEALTDLGLEVESILDRRRELSQFIVAEIIEAKPHPDADRLKICTLFDGNRELSVVCGAMNARKGIKVVLANIGTIIPNEGFEIKEVKIRGVKSMGMLCSAAELNIVASTLSQDGIIELRDDAKLGEVFVEYYSDFCLGYDPVFEISVTPNRSDALCVYGIARDLYAYGIGILKPYQSLLETSTYLKHNVYSSDIKVAIDPQVNDEACPIFAIREIKNINNVSSPLWISNLLRSVDIKPISAVVDVTNYICISYAQPMHAYDKISLDKALELGYVRQEKEFQALNDDSYKLIPGDLVVASSGKILSLAGIIGSKDSAVTQTTQNIVIEAAEFGAREVTRAKRRLKIDTDSSYRFERGINRQFVTDALEIATAMILSICSGTASEPIIQDRSKSNDLLIELSMQFLEQISGLKIPIRRVVDILTKLGFKINLEKEDACVVSPPLGRHDIQIKEDVVEEVLRIYGYDKMLTDTCSNNLNSLKMLPSQPRHTKITDDLEAQKGKKIREIRRMIAASGFDELYSWSFISSHYASMFSELKPELFLVNPISADLNYMRPSLIPNLLQAASKNLARSIKNLCFFEIGNIFSSANPLEGASLWISGIRVGNYQDKNCHSLTRKVDIYDVKADLSEILKHAGISIEECDITIAPSYFHPGKSGSVMLNKNLYGSFGEAHPRIAKAFDIETEVVLFDLCLDNLLTGEKSESKQKGYSPSNFQSNLRDYAFILNKEAEVGLILSYLRKLDPMIIRKVDLFDLYEGEKIPDGKKSIAISVTLQADNRTLVESELNEIDLKITEEIRKNFGGEIRSI